MKKITFIILLLFLYSNGIHSKEFNEKDPVKKLLVEYINKMNALTQGTQKEDVLELFDKKYSGNTVYVNLSGALVRKDYLKKDISSQLDDIINADNYSFKLTLDKIIFQNQKEIAGTISAIINFESSIDNKLAEKGTMLINLVAIRIKNNWKIVQNNMVRVSEAKDIGECVCYMYEKGSTKFVTEVYYPSGIEYSQKLNAFHVTFKNNKRLIKSEHNEYYWDKDTGKLTLKGGEIGQTSDSKKAVQYVLKDLYKDSCVHIVFN